MKKIEAIIRPSKLEEVKEAMKKTNISGITISQVMGCGKQHGWSENYDESEELINILSKIEIKMIIDDDKLEEVIELITSIARTGEIGDGKIFVTDISDCIRIRTGERGEIAL
ncbi:P-II family nitrogen regulator [Clostridium uliginosum]|uniref:Nitrogen regulatory protein P-II 1 n=1 Tax=Clostridium uliginosum TaxID=119641 RepID=A0A1I1P9R8_9CLOT|nr:P-II family nitrogen regulator [Clostridium uliginosum]SFD06644.1 nitrogen regulatory protein P-II 1 [Clostridium uliginosum]